MDSHVDLESLLHQDPESVIIPTIRNHPSLTQKILEDGSTLLHLACKLQSPLQVIQTILEVSPDSARMPNKDLFLPLHVACAKENADVKVVART
jgi:ankyrin repeat protein